ncbi:hypothetical protein RUND412_002172 [Rhizina undulata]
MVRLRSATKSAAAFDNINATSVEIKATPAKYARKDLRKRKFAGEPDSSPDPLTSPDINSIAAPETPFIGRLYPSLDIVVTEAQTDDSSGLYPSLNTAKTPRLSKIPTLAPTARKRSRFEREQNAVADAESQPGNRSNSGVPALGEFEFKFSEGLEEHGKKILEELKVPAAAIRAQMPVTPTGSYDVSRRIAPATTKKRRFDDAHRQEFDKMESIATHYAARRTPENTVRTPEEPPNVQRRDKIEGKLDDREAPASPSPVKNKAMFDMQRAINGITPLFQRTDASTGLTEKTARLGRLTIGGGATITPMKSGLMKPPATVSRMGMMKTFGTGAPIKKVIPVIPKPTASAESTPSAISPINQMQLDQVGVTRASKTPSTPAKSKNISLYGASQVTTPNTVAVPTFSFAALKGFENGTVTPKTSKVLRPPMASGGAFTFRAGSSGLGFRRLSDMHDSIRRLESLPAPPVGILATPRVTENGPLGMDDPFMGEGKRRLTAMEARNLAPETPVGATPMKFMKRKDLNPHAGQESGLPGRKRLRFDESIMPDEMDIDKPDCPPTVCPGTVKKQVGLLDKGKRLLTRTRLNMLATPRKRVSTLGGTGMTANSKGKPRWR